MSTVKARATAVARVLLLLLRCLVIGAALFVSVQDSADAWCLLINASLFLLPLALLLSLTGRWVWSLSIAAAFALFVYGMGELKFVYFYTRLIVADWSFVTEPANWTIVRQYPRIYTTLAGFSTVLLLLIIDATLATPRNARLPRSLRIGAAVLALSLVGALTSLRHHHTWEVWLDDANCNAANKCGVVSRLLFSLQIYEFEVPLHEGNPTPFLTAEVALGEQAKPALPTNPDVVLWLHESTFNPRQFQLPGAALPPLPMFERSPETRAMGLLRTHTFGGKTWLSEFSALSGLVPDDFGAHRARVFTTIGTRTQTNLFRVLKAQGYHTIVLMPTFKRFYGAGRTYDLMGADQILTLRDFPEYDKYPGDEWDIAETPRMAEAAIKLIREHRAGPNGAQPLFLYFLSVKEHAPYDKHTPINYKLDKVAIPKSLAAKLTDYVNRLVTLDGAVQTVNDYLFAKDARPAMFAYFGDHQAYYEEDSPPYRYKLPEPKNVTQFQVRSNYSVPRETPVPIMDIAFLPGLLVDTSGVERDNYFESLSAMRRLCKGMLDDCPDKTLVDSYKTRIFGRKVGLFPVVE
ncbi:sulfatase-like hydrolase/transferase [Nevskia ramosa]|uniref:sulfatase-like hydrolase/transferase n=1 Tax=Nevskia ramosa TaxID=64002 RepID=UPI002353D904